MTKKLFLFTFGILFVLKASSQTTFQKAFGGTASDEGRSISQTTDGGYIIAGTTTSFGAGGRDVLVIKTNALGDTSWTRTYGDANGNEYGYCIQPTSDGGYIVSGSSQNFFNGEEDMYILKLKANGDTTWTRTYGGNGYEWGSQIQQTTDGGYIIVGQTPAFSTTFQAYLVKINANGNILWTKTYAEGAIGTSVQQTTDGGYIVTGEVGNVGAGSSEFYLLKTDASGNVTWAKAFGNSGFESGKVVRQTVDGGYIIAGTSEEALGPLGPDMCLIKTNSAGDTLWTKLYGGALIDECYDVVQTNDGGYLMCGKSFSFSTNGDYDVYIVKVNSSGNVQWSKTYGASGTNKNEIGNSIAKTADGGYIITGESLYSFGVGLRNLYVVKIDSLGNSGCNETSVNTTMSYFHPVVTSISTTITSTGGVMNLPVTMINGGTIQTDLCISVPNRILSQSNEDQILIYPNPVSSALQVNFPSKLFNEFIIYDMLGRELLNGSFRDNHIIDVVNLEPGNYFLKVFDSKEHIFQTIKFLKNE